MDKKLKADLMLLFVTMCWGVSYLLMDICLDDMDPMNLNAFRFLIAFVTAFILAYKKLLKPSKATIQYSILISVLLMVVYCGATYGVKYTSISNAGFINGLSTVFTPIVGYFIFKKVPEKKLIPVIIMCTVGIALLSLNESLQFASGDLMCLAAAIAYAFDLCFTEKAVAHEEVNPFQLGVYQLLFTGIWMLIASFILETPHLPGSAITWGSALFLAIFCTGAAFVIQVIAQQWTTANRVGIIFSLEPVFSGIVAFLIANEVLLARNYVGALLMIAGMFIMEINFDSKKKKYKEDNN